MKIKLLIVAAFFLLSCNSGNPEAKAPSFSLMTIDGEQVTLSDYQGKVLMLNVWDTWCGPCVIEIPHFIELYDEYSKKGFEILGVAVGRNGEAAVKKFVVNHKINYPVALGNQDLFEKYGPIQAIPTTFLINKKGEIVEKYTGIPGSMPNRVKQVLKQKIEPLL